MAQWVPKVAHKVEIETVAVAIVERPLSSSSEAYLSSLLFLSARGFY